MSDLTIQMTDKDNNNLMPKTLAKNVVTSDANVELSLIDLQTKNQQALDNATSAKETADGLNAIIEQASTTANQAATDATTALAKGNEAYNLASTVEGTASEASAEAKSAKEDTVNLAVRVSSIENSQINYTVIP